jgi:DNA-binding MarR family transcriptional regulator
MPETSDDLQKHMVALIRAFGLHNPDITPCGETMSVSEAHTLMKLMDREALTQKELALTLQLEKSTVSRLVGNLEGRGWLVRETNPNDGRSVRLCLTSKGRQVAGKLAMSRAAKFARVAVAIPDEKRKSVLDALGVLTQAMNSDSPITKNHEEYHNR